MFMRTTVDLPDAMFRRAKALAALRGTSLKEIIQRALERELEHAAEKQKQRRVKLPLIRGKEKRILSLTNAEIDEIIFG